MLETQCTQGAVRERQAPKYVVSVMYVKPEFGDRVRFLLTYYAPEEVELNLLLKTLAVAFKRAHPSWKINKLIVGK